MVVINETDDGNWEIVFDYALPEAIHIEDGEIRNLRNELVRMFGLPDAPS